MIVCQVSVFSGFQGNLGEFRGSMKPPLLFGWALLVVWALFGGIGAKARGFKKLFIMSKLEMWLST